jgi:hypothetical protein
MKLMQIGLLGALPGFFAGAALAWIFTFQYFMPYVQVSEAWSFFVGFLVYVFVFFGLGTSIGICLGFAIAVLVGLPLSGIASLVMFLADAVSKAISSRNGES